MSESAFSNFSIIDDDPDAESTNDVVDTSDAMPRPGIFTILCDSLEQKPYQFLEIYGDAKDDYSPILVKTVKKRLKVGDYSIQGMECGIAIERKSKEDLFSSVANNAKRENFIERLRKMQTTLRYGAVVVEAYKQELFDDPPIHTSLNPKTVYRSALSWGIQFPLIHWHFCKDRDEAEAVTYRLLEKYYDHETNVKYKAHNRPVDEAVEAFRLGMISRMSSQEIQAVYGLQNPLRLHWLRGVEFYSSHFLGGERAAIYELGESPPSEVAAAMNAYKSKKSKNGEAKIKPLPNQTSFIDDELDEIIDKPQKKTKSK